jgi:hypothetical protein
MPDPACYSVLSVWSDFRIQIVKFVWAADVIVQARLLEVHGEAVGLQGRSLVPESPRMQELDGFEVLRTTGEYVKTELGEYQRRRMGTGEGFVEFGP